MITANGIEIKPTLFPDGTSQVWKLPDDLLDEIEIVRIRWEFTHEAEFMHLAQLKMLLDAYNVTSFLHLPYLPYGRQDKGTCNQNTFALNTFACLLNALQFPEITIMDPHSSAATAWIKNSITLFPRRVVNRVMEKLKANVICYPDEGAYERYNCQYDLFNRVLIGQKTRNQSTGNITGFSLKRDKSCAVHYTDNILIIDDICDGGATFIGIAEELAKLNPTSISLFVTHGIFSKGLKPLRLAGLKRIFTARGEVVTASDGDIGYKSW